MKRILVLLIVIGLMVPISSSAKAESDSGGSIQLLALAGLKGAGLVVDLFSSKPEPNWKPEKFIEEVDVNGNKISVFEGVHQKAGAIVAFVASLKHEVRMVYLEKKLSEDMKEYDEYLSMTEKDKKQYIIAFFKNYGGVTLDS